MFYTQESIHLITQPLGKTVTIKLQDQWGKTRKGTVIGLLIGMDGDISYNVRYMDSVGYKCCQLYRDEFTLD